MYNNIADMQGFLVLFIFIIAVIVIVTIIFTIKGILGSPFRYPYFLYTFDVSGKRQPKIEDYIDQYLINGGITIIEEHLIIVKRWKEESQRLIDKSKMKKRRQRQFDESVDDNHEFIFDFVRDQTRYQQRNYVRTAYIVKMNSDRFVCDYNYLLERYEKLKEINFEATLNDYNSTNQRKLMTKELKEKIKIRDNYTCQKCGKYMPDEVGLHVDHIVPVSKGGKSVESNLQVLCSKCNGSKYNKIE